MSDERECEYCRGTGRTQGRLAKDGECEVVIAWGGTLITAQCCGPAAYWYPAKGGGRMTLCASHAEPHSKHATAIGMKPFAAPRHPQEDTER